MPPDLLTRQPSSRRELRTTSGTVYRYSNSAVQLAAVILETIYERPYDELIEEMITGPLGMSDTRIRLDADQAARLAPGHDETGRVMPMMPEKDGAAGALKSTVRDLARYVRWQPVARDQLRCESRLAR